MFNYLIIYYYYNLLTPSHTPSDARIKYYDTFLNSRFAINGYTMTPSFFKKKSPNALETASCPHTLPLKTFPPPFIILNYSKLLVGLCSSVRVSKVFPSKITAYESPTLEIYNTRCAPSYLINPMQAVQPCSFVS